MSKPNTNDSSDLGSDDAEQFSWIDYFLTLRGNEFFCHVEDQYIQDNFNLTGLVSQVKHYEYALDVICDIDNEQQFSQDNLTLIEHDAEILYGLIHARYILSNRGLYAMMDKFRHSDFGCCPRVLCEKQSLLPIGLTEIKGKQPVKLYCGRCKEIYKPKSSRHDNVDGAYFGTTFPHLFFLVFPELQPKVRNQSYLPRVFGFRLHPSAHESSLEAAKQLKFDERMKQLTQK